MILVRMVFQAKFGRAGDVAAAMKEGASGARPIAKGARRVRILTDLSGRFDTVVQEMEYDSLDAFMQDQAAVFSSPEFQATRAQGMDLMEGGYKEYYTIEFEQ